MVVKDYLWILCTPSNLSASSFILIRRGSDPGIDKRCNLISGRLGSFGERESSLSPVLNKYSFQECEGSLKHKTELITKLEAKTLSMTETIQKMDEKYVYLSFISVN